MPDRYQRRAFKAWFTATAIGLAICIAPAASPIANDNVENLVVSANRTPTPKIQVGSSVSTVDEELLERRQTIFVTDVLQDLPGLAVSRTSGFGSQTQIRVRGAEANQVLVLIDGVEANDPAGNDEFDFASLTAYDIDRIEVVRGPQSALWGSDAAAGVISITTRQGRNPLGVQGFFEGGSFGTLNGGARISANGKSAGIDLGASYLKTDGISAAASGSEDDGYENTTLTLNSRWQPAASAKLGLFARYTDSTSEIDDFDFGTGLPIDADRESEDNLLLMQVSGALSLLEERWNQSLRLTYLDSDRNQLRQNIREGSIAAEKTGIYYQSTYHITQPEQGNGQRLILAVDHEQEDYQQRGEGSGVPDQDQDMHNTGYILEYLAEPLAGLDLSGSIRYDDNSDFDNITTWRLTSSYLLQSTDTRLHASYGTGQKSPTFTERYGFFPGQFIGNPDLKPEKTTGYDLGVDQGFLDSRIRAGLIYFNEKLEDEINGFAFDPNSGLSTATNLNGISRRKGLEFELLGKVTEDIALRASYTYTDSRQPNPVSASSREVRRPRHMAALNLNYAFLRNRANINLNASYTGEQTNQIFPGPNFFPQTVVLDDYVLADLAGSYAVSEIITLYARITNLFDENYSNVFGFQALGRGAFAGIRVGLSR